MATDADGTGGGATTRFTEPDALADVATVLELCAAGKLRCSAKTGRPSAATVGLVAGSLARGDFYPDEAIAAFAWPLLVQAGGLARLDGTRLGLTPKGRKALGSPPQEVIRALWERWPRHAPIDEFSRVEQIKGQRSANVLTGAEARRRTVVDALPLCSTDRWTTVDELFAGMQQAGLHPTIARSERAIWKLYLEDPQYGSLGYDGHHDWSVVEGRYTLAVLFEYAATLGLIDVTYRDPVGARDDYAHMWGADELGALSRYDGLSGVRLNPLGSYAAGLTDVYVRPFPDAAPPSVQVLVTCDVVATDDLPAADRLVLDAHATRTSDRVWALSAPGLLAAVDAGRDLAEFGAFLTDRAAHGVPSTVRTLLDDVIRRSADVRDLGLRRVLECADPSVAALIARDRVLRRYCTPLGDRHLLLADGAEPKVRGALRTLGYALGPGA